MVKVFRLNSPLSALLLLAFLALFVVIGLPLVLVAIASFVLVASVKKIFGPAQKQNPLPRYDENSHISPVIHNNKIGSYRVIENPNDPDVIEVEKV